MSVIEVVPCPIVEANAFVREHHRHHRPSVGGLFAVGCSDGTRMVGVALVGRPVARRLDDDFTAEVTRLCVDRAWIDPIVEGIAAAAWMNGKERGLRGLTHAEFVQRALRKGSGGPCSMLYAAAWRACKALGYRRLVTYTLPEEGGASLRAAGWVCIGEAGGGSWSCKTRPRVDKHPTQVKFRWEAPMMGNEQ